MLKVYIVGLVHLYLLGSCHHCPNTDVVPELKCDVSGEVFTYVESMPQYVGGNDALLSFINSNLVYPDSARKNKIEGRTIIRFIVDTYGKLKCIKVVRGFNKDCDAEALRIVSLMPDWQAGMHNHIPVNVSYTIPIDFKL